MKRFLVIAVLAALGIVNAAYLSYEAYLIHFGPGEVSSICNFSPTMSCSNALSSPYALFFGAPFPWIALVVYPILFALAIRGLRKGPSSTARILAVLSALGIGFNGIVIYRETFLIHAYCPLCLLCTAFIVSIFGLSFSFLGNDTGPEHPSEQPSV
ncbi:MAG: hypothetical protein HGA38_04880 [Candidatus Moranbacteria bacterium]|nr:hypothetical protein [Candidatus Moranbacteria bacterium]